MKKKRVLFCMNVPWEWIKQRPHFIAEGLAQNYDVTVLSPLAFHKYQSNDTGMQVKKVLRLPFERFSWIAKISAFLQKIQFNRLAKHYDVIWLSLASQYSLFNKQAKAKTIVYDCMDDMLGFEQYQDSRRRDAFLRAERDVFMNSNVVFTSSEHLKTVLIGRYGQREVHVVNNALRDGFAESSKPLPEEIQTKFDVSKKHISYIGTIDSWMDFDLLLSILSRFQNIIVHLWGPVGNVKIPQHERLILEGSVEHSYVSSIMKASNLLMMPFNVTPLIESVNPVKLYEYIYSGRPCLAPLYGESEQFGAFCYLYQTHQECLNLIESFEKEGYSAKKPMNQCEAYARDNTWTQRVKQMEALLL